MKYSIKTNEYQGPMDLLFELINKNKIDIRDISIVEITEQYVDYIKNMDEPDLDLESDFIAMAAKLLEIKSRYILYLRNQDEEDPRDELVKKIEEYKALRDITEKLKENIKDIDNLFFREEEIDKTKESIYDLSKVNLDEIRLVLPKVFKELKVFDKEMNEKVREERLEEIVKKKTTSVETKVSVIREKISGHGEVNFSEVISQSTKDEVIASFLAILELIKLREIIIIQKYHNDKIIIKERV